MRNVGILMKKIQVGLDSYSSAAPHLATAHAPLNSFFLPHIVYQIFRNVILIKLFIFTIYWPGITVELHFRFRTFLWIFWDIL
jgi:hypothetical protein